MNACKVLELATDNNIIQLINLAKQEISENAVKENHGASGLKRFKLILKYLKGNKENRPQYSNVWINNGFQCFTNGYTGFLLKNHIENLPTIIPENPINLEEISRINPEKMQKVNFDIVKIKSELKIYKSENKVNKKTAPYHYDIGKSRYNAKYLIDCYTILGGENINFWQPKNGKLIASVFESENGKAVILPIRKQEK